MLHYSFAKQIPNYRFDSAFLFFGGNTDFWVLGFGITMTSPVCVCVCVRHRVDFPKKSYHPLNFKFPGFSGARVRVHGCHVEEMLCVGGWGIGATGCSGVPCVSACGVKALGCSNVTCVNACGAWAMGCSGAAGVRCMWCGGCGL